MKLPTDHSSAPLRTLRSALGVLVAALFMAFVVSAVNGRTPAAVLRAAGLLVTAFAFVRTHRRVERLDRWLAREDVPPLGRVGGRPPLRPRPGPRAESATSNAPEPAPPRPPGDQREGPIARIGPRRRR